MAAEALMGSPTFRAAVGRIVGDALGAGNVILECDLTAPDAVDRIAETELGAGGRLIVCSPRAGPRAIRRAIDSGADSIVWVDRLEASLAAAVEAVRAGLLCFPQELKRHITAPTLTNREKQVLGQIVLGMSNREIADALSVGETTVKTHVRNILVKLGARSRSEAASMVVSPSQGLGLGILAITTDGAKAHASGLGRL